MTASSQDEMKLTLLEFARRLDTIVGPISGREVAQCLYNSIDDTPTPPHDVAAGESRYDPCHKCGGGGVMAVEPCRCPGESSLVERLRGPIKEAAQRLINGSFRRDGEMLSQENRPRLSIPCRPDYDDDIVVTDAILEAAAAIEKLEKENAEFRKR